MLGRDNLEQQLKTFAMKLLSEDVVAVMSLEDVKYLGCSYSVMV